MAFVPASTIFGFAYFMDGEEFSIELRQDMRNLRFQGREYLTPIQGRYDSINQTLFGDFITKVLDSSKQFSV